MNSIFVQTIIVLCSFFSFVLINASKVSRIGLIIPLFLVYLSFYIFYMTWRKRFKTNFFSISPSIIFVISLLIASTQNYLLRALNIEVDQEDLWLNLIWQDDIVIIKSIWLISCAFSSFVLGYIVLKKDKTCQIDNTYDNDKTIAFRFFYYVTIILFFVYLAYLPSSFWARDFKEYMNDYTQKTHSYLYLVLSSFLCIYFAFYFHFYNNISIKDFFKQNKILLFESMLYCLFCFLSGDRGPAIYIIMLFWALFFNKLEPMTKMFIVFISMILMFYISSTRIENLNKYSSQSFSEQIGQNFFSATNELANTIICVHSLYCYVPRYKNYEYGSYFFREGLLNCIPGLSSYLSKNYNSTISSSAIELTEFSLNTDTPSFGLGSHVTADFFFDFGIYGVIVGLFLVGVLFSYSDYAFFYSSKNFFLSCLCVLIYSRAIYLPRAPVYLFLKEVCYIFYVYVLFAFLLYIFNKQKMSFHTDS